ncbi:hypothetical protein BDZ45DRAFT_11164 [Acephala macrosclerotiorum]|nr:hypothetical protein BDZ45DRAFT_11164 [Acephala macrosclerotiorum]
MWLAFRFLLELLLSFLIAALGLVASDVVSALLGDWALIAIYSCLLVYVVVYVLLLLLPVLRFLKLLLWLLLMLSLIWLTEFTMKGSVLLGHWLRTLFYWLMKWVRAALSSLFTTVAAISVLGLAYIFLVSEDSEYALETIHQQFLTLRKIPQSHAFQFIMVCLIFYLVSCFSELDRYPYTVRPLRAGFWSLWQTLHESHSLDDGEHGEKCPTNFEEPKDNEAGKEKEKCKKPRARPPTVDEQPPYVSASERPQPSPHQRPGVNELKQRSSSGSNSGGGKKARVKF